MANHDPALVFLDSDRNPADPSTHVLLVGVGKYEFGKGAAETPVAGGLSQLTSPPISARAMADWFIGSFRNPDKPLASVAMLLSENPIRPYQPPRPGSAPAVNVPPATLRYVRAAGLEWAKRAASNQENLAVFYFCGHGASMGQQASLLLSDFGKPDAEYDGAIDFPAMHGTMKNSPAIQQVFLLDCCRTHVDHLYLNEPTIGLRPFSIVAASRGHEMSAQQFVLFPSIDGEEAFGLKDRVSAFTSSILDAVQFAAGDFSTGKWKTTTGGILSHVDRLVQHRIPASLLRRSKPNALDASSFDFNEIPDPVPTRSVVTLSDVSCWREVELSVTSTAGNGGPPSKRGRDSVPETFCTFDVTEGAWRFSGKLPQSPPTIAAQDRTIRTPVAYVTLEVSS